MTIILSRIFFRIRKEKIEILFVSELPARVMPDSLIVKTTRNCLSDSKVSNGIITANRQSRHSVHTWRCVGKSGKSEQHKRYRSQNFTGRAHVFSPCLNLAPLASRLRDFERVVFRECSWDCKR